MMKNILIFTDAATSPQLSIAVGAFLMMEEEELQLFNEENFNQAFSALSKKIVYTEFPSKKSTWSEITTAMTAIHLTHKTFGHCNIKVYTDCQNLCDLVSRRKEKLQKNNFMTRAGKILEHAELYKTLFSLTEKYSIQFLKLKGHNKITSHLSLIEKIFSLIDKSSRQKLRIQVRE
jgi:ribonuclease HI